MSEKIEIDKKDLAERDKKISKQQEEIESLKADMKKLSQATKNSTSQLESSDQELLGELEDPIKRMITSAINGVSEEIGGNFKELNNSIKGLQENINKQNQSLFSGVASTTLKDYSKITNSSEFKGFMEEKVKGVGVTWGDSWASAKKANDMSTMKEIIDTFLETENGAAFSENAGGNKGTSGEDGDEEESAGADEVIEPKGSVSSAGRSSTKWKFKVSDFQEKMDLFKRGEISIEDLEAFEAKFEEATDNGQVLDDRENVAEQ